MTYCKTEKFATENSHSMLTKQCPTINIHSVYASGHKYQDFNCKLFMLMKFSSPVGFVSHEELNFLITYIIT